MNVQSSKSANNIIAGAVVLFNPGFEVLTNIETYLNQLNYLVVIDNSDTRNNELYKQLVADPRIKYISCGRNIGVAAALNMACTTAYENNCDFLLTMDQDTSVEPNLINNYLKFINHAQNVKLGIIAPFASYLKNNKKKDYVITQVVITSGSLINMEAYKQAGPFIDKLFIDYVDYEYCLRLRKMGFQIIQIPYAIIHHQIGDLETRRFAFTKVFVTNHSPLRYYYRTRNRLFVAKSYYNDFPLFVIRDLMLFINEGIKIILYEKDKIKKLHMIYRGIKDFLTNKFGQYA